MEIIPIIFGCIFSTIGIFLLYDTYYFRQIATLTDGKLVGYESHLSRSKNHGQTTMYTPVVEFNHLDEIYCFKTSVSSSNMPYEIEQAVPVLYLEQDPHDARIKTNMRYWVGGIFSAIGLTALVFGLINFQYDTFSLILAGSILTFVGFKIFKFKQKLNDKGIHSIADIKKKFKQEKAVSMQTSDVSTNDSSNNYLHKKEINATVNKNYQPSDELIRSNEIINKKNQTPKWVSLIFVFIGLGLCIGGGYWVKQRADFFAIAKYTQGKVVSMKSSYSDGSTVYYPMVNYIYQPNNQSVTFKHNVGSSHPSWSTGDKVVVLYNPADKDDAMIDDGWMNWLGPGLLSGLGIVFLLSGLSFLRRGSPSKQALPSNQVTSSNKNTNKRRKTTRRRR